MKINKEFFEKAKEHGVWYETVENLLISLSENKFGTARKRVLSKIQIEDPRKSFWENRHNEQYEAHQATYQELKDLQHALYIKDVFERYLHDDESLDEKDKYFLKTTSEDMHFQLLQKISKSIETAKDRVLI